MQSIICKHSVEKKQLINVVNVTNVGTPFGQLCHFKKIVCGKKGHVVLICRSMNKSLVNSRQIDQPGKGAK